MSDLTERLRSWGNWFTSCALGNPSDEVDMVMEAATEIEALRRENQELRYALTEAQDVLALMDSEGRRAEIFQGMTEDNIIRNLCEQIGYGAVMDSAARQWFKKDSVGAITTGTCAGTLRNLKALISRALTMSDIHREQLDRPADKETP